MIGEQSAELIPVLRTQKSVHGSMREGGKSGVGGGEDGQRAVAAEGVN
jgi:hypothetical protein